MEAERSYSLLSVSWKTGQASGIIQLAYEGPRTRSSDVQGQEKMAVPAPGKEKGEQILPSSTFLFSPGPQGTG